MKSASCPASASPTNPDLLVLPFFWGGGGKGMMHRYPSPSEWKTVLITLDSSSPIRRETC